MLLKGGGRKTEIVELNNAITVLKTSLEKFNSRHNPAEERIRNSMIGHLKLLNQESKNKIIKKSKKRDLCGNIK